MDDKFVVICATGRSGSTTMLRILNTVPNTNICGENDGAIISLLEFYKHIKYTTCTKTLQTYNSTSLEQIVKERRMSPSWYNSYNYNAIVMSIRYMIINLFKNKPDTNMWGFKEIRFLHRNIETLKELKELFPQLKVIIHVKRNIAQQCRSQWKAWNQKDRDTIEKMAKANNDFFNFYARHRDFCYFSTFEDMFDMNKLREIFRFIGCENKFNEQKIKEILADNLH